MEIYLQFIFLLAVAKYSLKASMNTRWWVTLLYPLAAAVAAYLIYPWMIRLRGDSFTAILADKGLVADCAVLITIEAILGILSSIYILDNYFRPKSKRKRSVFILKVVPGVLVFVGIAYFELAFFKQFAGVQFGKVALMYSGVVFFAIAALASMLKWLMRGESLKLEAKITLNLLILCTALFVNASLADYSVSHAQTAVEWLPVTAAIGLFALMGGIGMWCYSQRGRIKALFHRDPKQIEKNNNEKI